MVALILITMYTWQTCTTIRIWQEIVCMATMILIKMYAWQTFTNREFGIDVVYDNTDTNHDVRMADILEYRHKDLA